MSSSAALITCKTDPAVKEQARRVFADLGLDMTSAINMFLRQVVRTNGIPFALSAGPVTPAINPAMVYTPQVGADGTPILPADWDDPEDAVYDTLYADA